MRPVAEWQDDPKLGLDGTQRARRLEETWDWLGPKAALAGVTRIGNVTGLDIVDIPVWVSVRPNARGLSVSQGKGATHLAAKISALMESIENWHAESIDLPARMADHATMREGAEVADPSRLSRLARGAFRDDLSFPWIEGIDIAAARPCWVPFEAVSTDYVVPLSAQTPWSIFIQSSNGLAGGNTQWEASCHALAELVERHTIWANETAIRRFSPDIRLDPDSIEDEQCRRLIGRLEKAGLLVALFMLASDVDASGRVLPVAACSIIEADETARWRNLPPFNGYGCHLDPAIALSRAISEAAQSRLTYIAGGRDDISAQEYRRGGHPDDLSAYRSLFETAGAELDFANFSGRAGRSFKEDFETMARLLSAAGYDQIVIIDLSKEDIGVPVVKAVVPGLAIPGSLIGGQSIEQPSALAREQRA